MPNSGPLLLKGLSATEREGLLALAKIREFPAKTYLYRQGQPIRDLYLIKTGCVVFVGRGTSGRRSAIVICKPGDAIGIFALANSPAIQVGAFVALAPTTAWVWPSRVVCHHALYPKLAGNALSIAIKHIDAFRDRHIALLTRSAEQRVADALTMASKIMGIRTDDGVELALTNNDLAALADTTLFTVSRQVTVWERQEILTKSRGRLLLRDPARLRTE